jgi:hypothetical protein
MTNEIEHIIMPIDLKIQGAKDSESSYEAKEEKSSMIEELALQDIDVPRPTEIQVPHEDTSSTSDISHNSKQQAQVNKRLISDKQKAHLEKARAIRKEKALLRKQGQDLGSLPEKQPNLVQSIAESLDQKFERWQKILTDMRIPLASERQPDPEKDDKQVSSSTTRLTSPSMSVNDSDVSSSNIPSRDLVIDRQPRTSYESLRTDYKGPSYNNTQDNVETLWSREKSLKRKQHTNAPLLIEDQSKRYMSGSPVVFF